MFSHLSSRGPDREAVLFSTFWRQETETWRSEVISESHGVGEAEAGFELRSVIAESVCALNCWVLLPLAERGEGRDGGL